MLLRFSANGVPILVGVSRPLCISMIWRIVSAISTNKVTCRDIEEVVDEAVPGGQVKAVARRAVQNFEASGPGDRRRGAGRVEVVDCPNQGKVDGTHHDQIRDCSGGILSGCARIPGWRDLCGCWESNQESREKAHHSRVYSRSSRSECRAEGTGGLKDLNSLLA